MALRHARKRSRFWALPRQLPSPECLPTLARPFCCWPLCDAGVAYSEKQAQDLTQGSSIASWRSDTSNAPTSNKGRFRSFLGGEESIDPDQGANRAGDVEIGQWPGEDAIDCDDQRDGMRS